MSKKRIFKKFLAIELISLGHRLVKVEKNKFNDNYLVYVFESSTNFYEDLCKLTNR